MLDQTKARATSDKFVVCILYNIVKTLHAVSAGVITEIAYLERDLNFPQLRLTPSVNSVSLKKSHGTPAPQIVM